MELGCITLRRADVVANPEAPEPILRDFMEVSSCRRDQSLNPFSASLPSKIMGVGGGEQG